MAKQIYIDSNGNEVLVSGTITNDNNLPHYTGTPTEGTTAYEIAKSKEWIRVDEKQGSTAIDLPATWNELFVICRYGTSGGAQPQLTTGVLIPILAGRSLIIGGGSLFAQVDLNAQGTQIQMNYFEINSTNYTSTSYFTVYYR